MINKPLSLFALILALAWVLSPTGRAYAQDSQPAAPAAATPAAAQAPARTGTVLVQLVNGTPGGQIPGNLALMLHAWDEASETLMLDGTLDEEGFARFENVEFQERWQYAAMVTYNDVTFFSEAAPALPDLSEIKLPLTVYETTPDASAVRVSQLHTFLEFTGGEVTVSEVYVVSNDGDRVVAGGVTLPDGRTAALEFSLPAGANTVSFGANQSQGRFSMIDAGRFADTAPLQPGMGSAQIIVQYTLPYQSGMELAHPILYPVDGLNVIERADAGVTITGPGLGEPTTETMGDGGSYAMYSSGPLAAPGGLLLNLAGQPNEVAPEGAAPAAQTTSSAQLSAPLNRLALPITGGILGLTLIGTGLWWLRRSGRPGAEADVDLDSEAELDPLDVEAASDGDWSSVVKAIARLDAAHERGEVPETEYGEQRAVLKARARELLQAEADQEPAS